MDNCCGKEPIPAKGDSPLLPERPEGCCAQKGTVPFFRSPWQWFDRMIENCLAYARQARQEGRPVVGILCEFTPRELIMAAGAVPVCLCGGSQATIPAAETILPSNLCPLIKSTFGYHVLGSNPFLEMADLIVAETTCDGKKKMYELLGRTRPVYVLELPQKPSDADSLDHWVLELRKFRRFLEERFKVEICDARLREATGVMNRERDLRRRLAATMTADRPPLTGRQLLSLKSSISGIPADLAQYQRALAMLAEEQMGTVPICRNGPEGASHKRGLSPFSSPADRPVRVLLTGVPVVHGAERVIDLIETAGGLVVAMENCTGLKPILDDVDENAQDPLRALAEKYFHLPCSVMTPNDRRMDVLRRLARDYRPECVVELIWQACLTYDVESARVRELVEKELKLPYLRIETDYSPSDTQRIQVRLEALLETVQSGRRA